MKYHKWIKKIISSIVCVAMTASILAGCVPADKNTETAASDTSLTGEGVTMKVGSLKGPTSMGLLFLMDEAKKGKAQGTYEFTMAVQADELLPLMVKGDLDVALVPANVASVLYRRMEGQLAVVDINTLGVLYMVTGDESITSVEDLKDRTVYLTGKGTTPDYVLRYILAGNGLSEDDCKLEYKSEATEVAALLAKDEKAVGLLPQPFVTVACTQNQELSVVLDMNEEWTKLQGEEGSRMVTGVTVVRKAFLEEHEEAVKTFLKEHEESVDRMKRDTGAGAVMAVETGIIAKGAIALKAIPACNITYIDGAAMKQALSGYLSVLYEQNPESVGGELPAEDFYYVP